MSLKIVSQLLRIYLFIFLAWVGNENCQVLAQREKKNFVGALLSLVCHSSAMWFWIIAFLLTFVAMFGNAQVIYLILTRRRLRTKSNQFILSLAVADLALVSVFIPPHFACQIAGCTHSVVILHLVSYFGEASVTNIIAFTMDRYFAIVKPLKYTHTITKTKIALVLTSAWLAPIVLDIIPTVLLSNENISQLISMAIFQIAPCFLLVIATREMIKIAKKHSRRTSVLLKQLKFNQWKEPVTGKPEASSARLISIVVGIFLICYTCQSLSSLCACFPSCKESQPENVVSYTLALLLIINSGANPFVYALLKRDMKKELFQIYICKMRRAS